MKTSDIQTNKHNVFPNLIFHFVLFEKSKTY